MTIGYFPYSPVRSLVSTTVPMSLSPGPAARLRHSRGRCCLHCSLDLRPPRGDGVNGPAAPVRFCSVVRAMGGGHRPAAHALAVGLPHLLPIAAPFSGRQGREARPASHDSSGESRRPRAPGCRKGCTPHDAKLKLCEPERFALFPQSPTFVSRTATIFGGRHGRNSATWRAAI